MCFSLGAYFNKIQKKNPLKFEFKQIKKKKKKKHGPIKTTTK